MTMRDESITGSSLLEAVAKEEDILELELTIELERLDEIFEDETAVLVEELERLDAVKELDDAIAEDVLTTELERLDAIKALDDDKLEVLTAELERLDDTEVFEEAVELLDDETEAIELTELALDMDDSELPAVPQPTMKKTIKALMINARYFADTFSVTGM